MKHIIVSAVVLVSLFSTMFAQNVGIGTTNPQSRLSINGNGTVGSNYINATAPADGLLIEGNVGIGNVSPNAKLQITDGTVDTVLIVQPGAGKYAAKFDGMLDVTDAIRNNGSDFDGSVAINDGLTVGDISGSQCNPTNGTDCTFFYVDGTGSFQIDPNEPPFATSNSPSCSLGQCRTITNFNLSATFFDFSFLDIKVDIYVLNQFQYKVLVSDAQDTSWTISFNSTDFNGLDPAAVSNWSILMAGYDPTGDSDRCEEYTGTISYNWGDSAAVSYYAAFGEVRASGTLYANSVNPYGDVAEFFEVTQEHRLPEAGDIVSIAMDAEQSFSLTTKANDPMLAGVISENPSIFINNPEMGEPIALTGRVKVKVNNEGGMIKPGDPITSSSTLAEGMKQTNTGQILGYALEAYDGKDNQTGKIWILLDKGHYETVAPITPVYAGPAVKLGGIELHGSQKVAPKTKEVFLAWSDMIHEQLPSDIDFEDLVVDLNPFGGSAMLSVNKVDANGVYVGINKSSKDFKGFYYNIDIVSPELYTEPVNTVNESSDLVSIEQFKGLYNEHVAMANELAKRSGSNFNDLPANMSIEEAYASKKAVLDAWAKADPKLFGNYTSLSKKLKNMLKDPELAKAVASTEHL